MKVLRSFGVIHAAVFVFLRVACLSLSCSGFKCSWQKRLAGWFIFKVFRAWGHESEAWECMGLWACIFAGFAVTDAQDANCCAKRTQISHSRWHAELHSYIKRRKPMNIQQNGETKKGNTHSKLKATKQNKYTIPVRLERLTNCTTNVSNNIALVFNRNSSLCVYPCDSLRAHSPPPPRFCISIQGEDHGVGQGVLEIRMSFHTHLLPSLRASFFPALPASFTSCSFFSLRL